jgi:hypothetical protein
VSRPGGGQADISVGIGLIIDEFGLRSVSDFMGVHDYISCTDMMIEQSKS